MNRKLFAFAIGIVFALAASQASASLISSVNFSSTAYSGAGAAPGAPVWQNFSSFPFTTTSGIVFHDSGPGPAQYNGTATEDGGALTNLLSSYTYGVGSTFSFTNVPMGSYTLYLYSQNGGNTYTGSAETNFYITGAGSTLVDYHASTASATVGLSLGGNYGVISNIVVGPLGTISGSFDDNMSGSQGAFNGFQLVFDHSVPEPSSLVLAGFGLAGAAVVARRRKQANVKAKAGRVAPNCLALAILAVLAASTVARNASAELINANVANGNGAGTADPNSLYSGTAVAGGGTWNQMYSGTFGSTATGADVAELFNPYVFGTGPLVNLLGQVTGISVSSQGLNAGGFTASSISMMNDYYNAGSGTGANIDILGLTPGTGYDLYLYGQNGQAHNSVIQFTVDGNVGASQTVTNIPGAGNDPATFIYGQNYVAFTGNVGGSGFININFADIGGAGNGAAFDAFQLVLLPEPSSFVLAGIGLVGAAFVARRRKQK